MPPSGRNETDAATNYVVPLSDRSDLKSYLLGFPGVVVVKKGNKIAIRLPHAQIARTSRSHTTRKVKSTCQFLRLRNDFRALNLVNNYNREYGAFVVLLADRPKRAYQFRSSGRRYHHRHGRKVRRWLYHVESLWKKQSGAGGKSSGLRANLDGCGSGMTSESTFAVIVASSAGTFW